MPPLGPNFFIAGAPKSGTTALHDYLRRHPGVFMSSQKEPHYFADDFTHFRKPESLDAYLALFKRAGPDHGAVGEASVWYLYSKVALQRIYDFNAAAKIILMFRNPVDFLPSLHSDLMFFFHEDEADFEVAWGLQAERRAGRKIPEKCLAPRFLQYGDVASFGAQLERVLAVFPPSQVKCILYDDFILDPGAVYRDVLDFLGLRDDGRRDFTVVNPAKTHRWSQLGAVLIDPPAVMRTPWNILKKIFGPGISRFPDKLIRANAVPRRPPPLSPAFRGYLAAEFSDDVAKLSRLMRRNLNVWMDGI